MDTQVKKSIYKLIKGIVYFIHFPFVYYEAPNDKHFCFLELRLKGSSQFIPQKKNLKSHLSPAAAGGRERWKNY